MKQQINLSALGDEDKKLLLLNNVKAKASICQKWSNRSLQHGVFARYLPTTRNLP